MNTLASPSSGVVSEIFRNREAAVLVNTSDEASSFFRPHKKHGDFRVLDLVAFLQHREPIKPVVCQSSKTQAEIETADAQIQEPYPTKTLHVRFQLQKECSFGQHFLIVGNDPILGSWDPECAIPMDWSDGNVWSVELDIPVGTSIQFKFILKGNTVNILWQPGPDRIFQTWESENTITVFEDWEDAELQKITEEGQVYNSIEASNINSDMLIPGDEDLTYPTEESAIPDTYTDPAQILLMEPYQEQSIADSISFSQEIPKTTAAENITRKWAKQFVEDQVVARTNVLDEEKVGFPSVDSADIPNKRMMTPNNVGINGRAATARNSDMNGSIMNYEEEGPVLVPGLTRATADPFEEANEKKVEKPMTFDGSVESYESSGPDMPENQWNQLEEKQEQDSEPPQAATIGMIKDNADNFVEHFQRTHQPAERENQSESVSDLPNSPPQAETTDVLNNNEVCFDEELEQKPQSGETAEQSASNQVRHVWHTDMQWSRKILQKLLISFRLP